MIYYYFVEDNGSLSTINIHPPVLPHFNISEKVGEMEDPEALLSDNHSDSHSETDSGSEIFSGQYTDNCTCVTSYL